MKALPGAVAEQASPAGPAAPAFVAVSAIFHYLGPALAVLLFARLDVFAVVWLRVASAAVVLTVWRRPWRLLWRSTAAQRRVLLALGVVLAAMNTMFYLAIARLPLATVGSVEFLGVIVLAAAGVRTPRNTAALAGRAFTRPGWLLTGVAVGVCSSVIPYVTDQLAMARLRRATFALMLSILPACATAIGLLVLANYRPPMTCSEWRW